MKKILVAYFSASGVTARVAQKLSQAIDGDLHEIIPAQPYSQADLNWTNPQSRSSQEMKNKAYRPAIQNEVKNMDDYDVIFIGFPIWWQWYGKYHSGIKSFLWQCQIMSRTSL